MKLIFEVQDAEEGGFWTRALGQSIFTQADTWDQLCQNVLEAVLIHFNFFERPDRIKLVRVA